MQGDAGQIDVLDDAMIVEMHPPAGIIAGSEAVEEFFDSHRIDAEERILANPASPPTGAGFLRVQNHHLG